MSGRLLHAAAASALCAAASPRRTGESPAAAASIPCPPTHPALPQCSGILSDQWTDDEIECHVCNGDQQLKCEKDTGERWMGRSAVGGEEGCGPCSLQLPPWQLPYAALSLPLHVLSSTPPP